MRHTEVISRWTMVMIGDSGFKLQCTQKRKKQIKKSILYNLGLSKQFLQCLPQNFSLTFKTYVLMTKQLVLHKQFMTYLPHTQKMPPKKSVNWVLKNIWKYLLTSHKTAPKNQTVFENIWKYLLTSHKMAPKNQTVLGVNWKNLTSCI